MKKFLFSLLVVSSTTAYTAGWETITGNGNLKKETRNASGYTGVSSAGAMNVQIVYGNSNSITIEADENLLPYIETSVENGNLIIKTKKGYSLKTRNKMVVNVSATKLTAVKLSGSGNVSGDGAFTNSGKTQIHISGSGNMKLAFENFNEIETSISGSGNIDLTGSQCNNITATISGSGNIDCSQVKVNDVFAKVSGSGNIKVHTTKSIDAKVSGSGNVYYKGNPTSITSKASGSGKVIKV